MQIIIEDHVLPQLLTSAMEAYDIEHRSSSRGKSKRRLETIGLLWGYTQPSKNGTEPRVVATMATVETSALREQDAATPDINSLQMKQDFFRRYWPQLELVGTFHSHPYDSLDDVKEHKGWRCSTLEDSLSEKDGCDETFFPWFHERFASELTHTAHLIVTISAMKKNGWALPDRLDGQEMLSGYVINVADRKLWIRGYAVEFLEDEHELIDMPHLDIPSLMNRFNK